MNKDVHDILNRYIAAEFGRSFVLPDVTELSRQRSAFLAKFGPEQLAVMGDAELLRQVPYNVTNSQPMDVWLEFKNDIEFDQALFGSVASGPFDKYGTWQTSSGWIAPESQAGRGRPRHASVSEIEALKIGHRPPSRHSASTIPRRLAERRRVRRDRHATAIDRRSFAAIRQSPGSVSSRMSTQLRISSFAIKPNDCHGLSSRRGPSSRREAFHCTASNDSSASLTLRRDV